MSAQTLCLLTLCTNDAFKDNKGVWPVSFPHKSIKLIRLKKHHLQTATFLNTVTQN